MKVYFSEEFYQVYAHEPAAAKGRLEAVVRAIREEVTFLPAEPAGEGQLRLVHSPEYLAGISHYRQYPVACLAAGAAIQAARTGLVEPAFALIRPPGHHASQSSAWGYCYLNNAAVALETLRHEGRIKSAFVLDIDMHFGDGTVNIFKGRNDILIRNIKAGSRFDYLQQTREAFSGLAVDIICVSAGFDNHVDDWGGLLETGDYLEIGNIIRQAAAKIGCGYFALLEGGYNHYMLGQSVSAFLQGMR